MMKKMSSINIKVLDKKILKQDKVNNADSAFIFLLILLISGNCQSAKQPFLGDKNHFGRMWRTNY